MINKILSLLHHAVPASIAFKGLQKINPRIGKFLTGAVTGGYTTDQAIDFLRNKFQTNKDSGKEFGKRPDERAAAQQVENSKQMPKLAMNAASLAGGLGGGVAASTIGNLFENDEEKLPEMATNDEEAGFQQPQQKKQSLVQGLQEDLDKQYGQQKQPNKKNIIQQYSPELFQFIQDQINSGRPVLEAGALAQQSKKYRHLIKKIEEDHKTPFSSILQVSFGEGLYPSGNKNQSQQGQQQPGKGQQALMQSMQQLTQLLGNRK